MKKLNLFFVATLFFAPSLLKMLPFWKNVGGGSCFAQTTQLWGMTTKGGTYNVGNIFRTDGSGNFISQPKSFTLSDGANPQQTNLVHPIAQFCRRRY